MLLNVKFRTSRIPVFITLVVIHLGCATKYAEKYEPLGNFETDETSTTSTQKSDFGKQANERSNQDTKSTKSPYPCPECSKVFHFRSQLGQHFETHSKLKKYKCDFCSSHFKTLEGRKGHMIEQHWDELVASQSTGNTYYSSLFERSIYSCHFCGKHLRSKSVFDAHIRVHVKGERYVCQVCKHKFPNLYIFTQHKKYCRRENIANT
ncbi:zinc finger protein 572 [Clonorchis sinensis]|uniref:Zinc finger protein 572 n=1 Tax=Clonorchis sinensis TaxID=79923 RepID=G7YHF2_CLOSI|nr:zinc finger protein 572 [Clonorchis sinensis]